MCACSPRTRSERCNLVKYLYPVIYWRLYKVSVGVWVGVRVEVRVGVRVGDRSYNMREINYNFGKLLELLVIVTNNLIRLTTFGSAAPRRLCAPFLLLPRTYCHKTVITEQTTMLSIC